MSATSAAAHERGSHHLACKFGVDESQLRELLTRADEAYGGLERLPASPRAEVLVMESRGLDDLWESGIHPDRVLEIHREIWPEHGAIPVRLYQSFGTYRKASEWHRWSGIGLQLLEVEQLLHSDFAPEDLDTIAQATSRTSRRVGVCLARWLRTGCEPSVEDVCELLGLPALDWPIPSKQAIELAWSEVGFLQTTRTQVGLVLAVTGSTAHTIRAIGNGARGPRDAYRYMAREGLI